MNILLIYQAKMIDIISDILHKTIRIIIKAEVFINILIADSSVQFACQDFTQREYLVL